MKYVAMRNEEKIADTCWGHHGDGKTLYTDIPGPGYCSFQIGAGSCALNLINVKYVNKNITDNATQEQIKELSGILLTSAGSQGNSFKGEDAVIKPDPDPEWS